MRLLTTHQVADRLQVSPTTLADWRWKKDRPTIPADLPWLHWYDEAALDLWVVHRTINEIPRGV